MVEQGHGPALDAVRQRLLILLLSVPGSEFWYTAPVVAVVVAPYVVPQHPLVALLEVVEWLGMLFVGYLISELVFPDVR